METGERSVYLVCTGPRTAIINKNFHVPENFLIHVSQHHYIYNDRGQSTCRIQPHNIGEEGGFVQIVFQLYIIFIPKS